MNYADYRISLDIFKTVSQATLPVKQFDTAYRLCITLSANGSPYIITDKCYARFTAKKPDGNVINNKCTIENNTIYYELTKQTTAALGMVECEIVLYDDNDEQLATPHFNILVDAKAYNGEEIKSSSEVNMLEDLIAESEAQIAEVEEKLANGEFKGEKGDAGEINFEAVDKLPTEKINEKTVYMIPAANPTEDNKYDEFIYKNGKWEIWGGGSVQADLTNYVKKTDYATETKTGVIKVSTWGGTKTDPSGTISIIPASNSAIDKKSAVGTVKDSGAITPSNLDYAVKVGVTTNTIALTDAEKTSAQEWLGISGGSAKQPISIVGMCPSGIQYVNQPIAIDDTKIYNTSLQLAYDEGGWTSMAECKENVTFTDGALILNMDSTGNFFVGVKIYANKVYDAATQTFTDKDGWLCVESQMEAYSGVPHHYVVVLAEA